MTNETESDEINRSKQHLSEEVDEARVMGGMARCTCGFELRFDGDESYETARDMWFTHEHEQRHFKLDQ